jgi:AbrB family looped-hinge helix DNA binding protein
MEAAKLTSKGQTTIPKRVREHLGLSPGDRVHFLVDEQGRVYLEPANLTLDELQAVLPRATKRLTVEQMNAAVRRRAGR